ncbi:hypothetical protein F5146DRAFT_1201855 [Armillaria mellea]|nr:hypothetical protein F5146DRAFT_1201855 [Armillaria mellea]
MYIGEIICIKVRQNLLGINSVGTDWGYEGVLSPVTDGRRHRRVNQWEKRLTPQSNGVGIDSGSRSDSKCRGSSLESHFLTRKRLSENRDAQLHRDSASTWRKDACCRPSAISLCSSAAFSNIRASRRDRRDGNGWEQRWTENLGSRRGLRTAVTSRSFCGAYWQYPATIGRKRKVVGSGGDGDMVGASAWAYGRSLSWYLKLSSIEDYSALD